MAEGNFIFFDMETLGVSDSALILSIGVIYVKPNYDVTNFKSLVSHGINLKINHQEQLKTRVVESDTLNWWGTQGEEAKYVLSNKDCIPIQEVYSVIKNYFKENNFDIKKDIIWSRGMIDQRWWQHFCNYTVKKEDFLPFWRWREVRTALDVMTGSAYGFNTYQEPKEFIKHNSLHDACVDAQRMFYALGKFEE